MMQCFDPDAIDVPVCALNLDAAEHTREAPMHNHNRGQLVVALSGGVICRTEKGLWMVPAGSGVWVPGYVRHSNEVTRNGRVVVLFIAPEIAGLPEHCACLNLSPLVIELICRLAENPTALYRSGDHLDRIAQVLLEELRLQQVNDLHLPIPDDPALRFIANALIENPGERLSLAQWASRVAMSERSLSRLVTRQTAMSFGRWRQQLQVIIALRQLSEGASVQNVADNLGYDSVSAFITMFRKLLGQSPARYAAQMAQTVTVR